MPKSKTALISVYNKKELVPFAKQLKRLGFKILSTGKTATFLRSKKIAVQDVSEYTGYPELLNGRVKTLHPKIHAGILADRGNTSHMKSLRKKGIEPIDLVVVDLYPFEEGLQKKMSFSKMIELIDIGGVTLLRAGAKNAKFVTVIPGSEFYERGLYALKKPLRFRREINQQLAHEAFLRTSRYDQTIQSFLGEKERALPNSLTLSLQKQKTLRYGENPHQTAAFYTEEGVSSSTAYSLQGKPLSFNNFLDLDTAYRIVKQFQKPCVTIMKHAAPCGVGLGKTLHEAFEKAWESDPESAFGGVVGLNRPLDRALTQEILSRGFLEVIAAPQIQPGALRLLRRRKNLRVVPFEGLYGKGKKEKYDIRQLSFGHFLVQTANALPLNSSKCRCVTRRKPTSTELASLVFSFQVAQFVQSNAIVIAHQEGTVGIGGGQPSRVGAVRVALEKAGVHAEGSVLASDGFFPFPDGVELAAEAGVRAIIQPGGSIRDREVIEACNQYDVAMMFTGVRHFKH